jgi:hypothetical protein
MKQEGRHIDFYVSQAKGRLTDSRAAQRLTRWALLRFWAPVGSGVMPDEEVEFLRTHLFGGSEGMVMADRIDRRVDRLPRLRGRLDAWCRVPGCLNAPAGANEMPTKPVN